MNFYASSNYVNRKSATEREISQFFFFFFFGHINLQQRCTFGKIKQKKNWTGSNFVCGFVGEITAYSFFL